MRRVRKAIQGLAVVLGLVASAPTAGAGELPKELGELASAVSARIDAATGTKEAKKLGKALKKVGKVDPATATPDQLRAVLKAVFGSKTVDAALVAEAMDVLGCLRAVVEAEKTDAAVRLPDLRGTYLSKLEGRLASADLTLAEAADLIATDPVRAAGLLLAAYKKYVATGSFAEKAVVQQARNGACGALPDTVGIRATVTGPGGFSRTISGGFANSEQIFQNLFVGWCKTGNGSAGTCDRGLTVTLVYPAGSRATGPVQAGLVRYTESSDFAGGAIQDLNWAAYSGVEAEISESTAQLIKGCFRGTLPGETVRDTDPMPLEISGTFVIRRPK